MDKGTKLGREINNEENEVRDESLTAKMKNLLLPEYERFITKIDNSLPIFTPKSRKKLKDNNNNEIFSLAISVLFIFLSVFILWQYLPLLLAKILPYVPFSWIQITSIILSILIPLSFILIVPNQEAEARKFKLLLRIPFALVFSCFFFLIVATLKIFPPVIVLIYSIWFFCLAFLFGASVFGGISSLLKKTGLFLKSIFENLADQIIDIKDKIMEKISTRLKTKKLAEKSPIEIDDFMAEYNREVENAKQELEQRDAQWK